MQLMLIRALVNQYAHLGDSFKVECPVGSGRHLTLLEVSQEIARRLGRLFIRGRDGRRPTHGDHPAWSSEHWRDHVLFHEYFHGETGAGVGASHQTGWTGVIAFLIQGFTDVDASQVLERGMTAVAEGSAEVAKEEDQPEAVQVAEEVHEEVAEKVIAQILETVQSEVTEAVGSQAGPSEDLQEKVEQIVMEKVAEAVQKKAEEVQQSGAAGAEEKKAIL